MRVVGDDEIVICTNCDAEFAVYRYDDDDDGLEVEFCPYCGHHLWEEDQQDSDDEED